MKEKYLFTSVILLISSLIIAYLPGCRSSPDDFSDGSPIELLESFSQADTAESREKALNGIVAKTRSLGVLDENGKQLNTNLSDNAISLTSDDIASFSTFIEMGHYSTISSVIDYLAEAGVVLSSTGDIITFEGLLPDLQQYVDWSLDNAVNTDSTLGLLLAAGPWLGTPFSSPTIEPTTQISHLAAILMLADILLGLQDINDARTGYRLSGFVYASELEESAKRIQGLITKIEGELKSVESTVEMFKGIGEAAGLIEPSQQPTKILKVPNVAKRLIGAFAAGSHFAVRIQKITGAEISTMAVVKSLELTKVGQSEPLVASLVLVPSGKNRESVPIEIVQKVPVLYSIRLLSPSETGVGIELYPDADAVLSSGLVVSETAAAGHILDIGAHPPEIPAIFEITATKLDNAEEPRTAIMHISASILTGDLGKQYEKYTTEYAGVISALGLKPDEIKQMFDVMKTAVNVSPWMAEVIFVNRQVTIEPSQLTGEINTPYTFTAKVVNPPAGSKLTWEFHRESGVTGSKPDDTIGPENVATVTFPDEGTFNVKVTLFEHYGTSEQEFLGSAIAKVIIKEKPKIPDLQLSIEPSQINGETDCGLNFKAVTNIPYQELPGNILWEWDFGDGNKDDKSGNVANNVYKSCGQYEVQLMLRDGDTKDLLATAEPADVNIDDSEALHRTRWVEASLWILRIVESFGETNGARTTTSENQQYGPLGLSNRTAQKTLEWKADNEFEVAWTVTSKDGNQTTNYKISGKVSPCEKMLNYIILEQDFIAPEYNNGKPWTRKEELILKDVPISKSGCEDSVLFNVRLSGEEVRKYIGNYKMESKVVDGRGDQVDDFTIFKNFNWNYPSHQAPKLEIRFSAAE